MTEEAAIVVAKAPRAGDVKTRLAERIGPARATQLYTRFLCDTFALVRSARAVRPAIVPALCYSPEDAGEEFDFAAGDVPLRFPQRGTHLGERLENCFADAFAGGVAAAVAIGADSPNLPADFLVRAFRLLSDPNLVVFGPSEDGGYYLIGMSRPHAGVFDNIPWSTGGVLRASLRSARNAGLAHALLPKWYDVDVPSDIDRLRGDLARDPSAARATWDYLARMPEIAS